MFWRLQTNRIDHNRTFFCVRLDRENILTDLKEMPLKNVYRIWKALTSSQRKKTKELSHTLPPT